MNIPPKIQPIIYGLGVFVIFTIVMILMKLVTHRTASDEAYFGLMSKKDLLMGGIVAIILTFSHERKKKLK